MKTKPITAAMSIDEAWALVHAAEAYGRYAVNEANKSAIFGEDRRKAARKLLKEADVFKKLAVRVRAAIKDEADRMASEIIAKAK